MVETVFKIVDITDHEGNKKPERIGSLVYDAKIASLMKDKLRFFFRYADGNPHIGFITSPIEKVEDFNGGFKVFTENSIYTLEGTDDTERVH